MPPEADVSDLTRAEDRFRKGQYAEALELYLSLDGPERVGGVVGASRTNVMNGKYAEAEEICRKALKESAGEERILCQLAEVLAMTGRSDDALELLSPTVKGADPFIRNLVQYGRLLRLRGRGDEAISYFEKAISLFRNGMALNGEEISMTALACRLSESYHDANRLFREALGVDPENLETKVLWGDLFREKYNDAEARQLYQEALKQNERYEPALVGMSKTLGRGAAEGLLGAARDINPRSASALEALAEFAIEDDLLEVAEEHLATVLRTNPESVNARCLLAAIAFLRENSEAFVGIQRAVDRFSPGNPLFYGRIAEICGRKYLFKEAVDLARRAVETDPSYWNGYTLLGVNLLRLGKESEGRTHLEYAFEQDPFNFWALNMLKVLDTLASFETRKTGPFIVRMHPDEADILWPYLSRLLERCWETLTSRYRFTPEGPILIEVFNKKEDFSVRTSGLPEMGPLVGVCFGRVITLDSPNAMSPPRSMNWQEIVWHEFVHVITLQMTRNRIPRWLSEGVSVFEESRGRPEWGRKKDLDLVQAVQTDSILSLPQLNEGFTKAKSLEDLSFAYFQSALVVEYIVERYGFSSLSALIYRYGTSDGMESIFKTVFGISLSSFEAGFRSWIKKKAAAIDVVVDGATAERKHYGMQPRPPAPSPGVPDRETAVEALRKRTETHPRDFYAHLHLGLLLYEKKDADGAVIHLMAARDLLPEYAGFPNPRHLLATIYEERGDEAAMLRELEALAKVHQHGFDLCYKLARAAYRRDDYNRALYYLARAIAVDPYHEDTHRVFAAIATKRGDVDTAVREYKVLLKLDTKDPVGAYTDLAEAYLRGGNKAEAKETVISALEIAPSYERAQHVLLESIAQ